LKLLNTKNEPYILKMRGIIEQARGYGGGYQLTVHVQLDAAQFRSLVKRKQNPLHACMAQIKNVVLDATRGEVRGMPSYAPQSMYQHWPRAKNGVVTIELSFGCSAAQVIALGAPIKEYYFRHAVDLQTVLESTRNDGHLFAKSAIAAAMGH
jgi:hypothetical protein